MRKSPMSKRDRRRSPRIPVLGEIQAHLLPEGLPVPVLDLSAGGFALQSVTPFERGTALAFEFHSRHCAKLIVRAVNVHCLHVTADDESWYIAGFAFDQWMGAADRRRIKTLLEDVLHARHAVLVD
jgi:hypothetical protein